MLLERAVYSKAVGDHKKYFLESHNKTVRFVQGKLKIISHNFFTIPWILLEKSIENAINNFEEIASSQTFSDKPKRGSKTKETKSKKK